MTPAKIGESCIPCLTGNLLDKHDNINMVTCGGQATIPIFHALSKVIMDARDIKVNTQVTPDSVGQATFDNIDNYYSTTAAGIKRFSGFTPDTIILAVDDSPTRDAMTSEITLAVDHCDIDAVNAVISKRVLEMQAYVPGYNLVAPATFSHGVLSLTIRVIGDGSWIPPHAGNLDIINCAAIAAAEDYATAVVVSKPANTFSPYTLVKEWFRPGSRWGSQA
jgi:acetaldehyde dehydrogenase